MSGDYPDIISMDATDYVNYAQTGVILSLIHIFLQDADGFTAHIEGEINGSGKEYQDRQECQ